MTPKIAASLIVAGLATAGFTAVAWGQPAPAPSFVLPLACRIGQTCEIQHYLDRDPGPGVLDYRCGHRTYDKHNGIDIRLLDLRAEQGAGTAVLAAAAGKVSRLRDGAPDISIRAPGAGSVVNKECGNGVVIDHGGGWETQYCHLQKGSIGVAIGQPVAAGQAIAKAGLSGDTEFPHLHFTVRRAMKIVDPFAPDPAREGQCGAAAGTLWSPATARDLAYKAGVVLNAGWAGRPIAAGDVETGAIAAPTQASPAVVAYFRLIGLAQGDVLDLSLVGPRGETLAKVSQPPLDHDKDQYFSMIGKKGAPGSWGKGAYRAEVRVIRGGAVALSRRIELNL